MPNTLSISQGQVQGSAEWRSILLGSGWPETTGFRREGTQAEAGDLSGLPSQEALGKCEDRGLWTSEFIVGW